MEIVAVTPTRYQMRSAFSTAHTQIVPKALGMKFREVERDEFGSWQFRQGEPTGDPNLIGSLWLDPYHDDGQRIKKVVGVASDGRFILETQGARRRMQTRILPQILSIYRPVVICLGQYHFADTGLPVEKDLLNASCQTIIQE